MVSTGRAAVLRIVIGMQCGGGDVTVVRQRAMPLKWMELTFVVIWVGVWSVVVLWRRLVWVMLNDVAGVSVEALTAR